MTHLEAQHTHDADPPAPWPNAWTQERVALLTELRNSNMRRGLIAATINKQTGSNFTTNAICGKIDRLFPELVKHRLTEEERAASAKRERERNIARQRERRAERRASLGLPPDVRHTPRKVQPFSIVISQPTDFPEARVHGVANLEKHHCRWIINDDAAAPIYCGLPKMDGSSYCSHCHRVVWVPPQKRRVA